MKNPVAVVGIPSQSNRQDTLMIHGIYLKSRPKGKWHLVSVAISPEAANHDITEVLKQAQLEGNEQAEVAAQLFDSAFWIPEFLSEVKQAKPLYN